MKLEEAKQICVTEKEAEHVIYLVSALFIDLKIARNLRLCSSIPGDQFTIFGKRLDLARSEKIFSNKTAEKKLRFNSILTPNSGGNPLPTGLQMKPLRAAPQFNRSSVLQPHKNPAGLPSKYSPAILLFLNSERPAVMRLTDTLM